MERDLIRTRTAKGRSRAKGMRKAYGPTSFPDVARQKAATRRRKQGATLQQIADSYDRSIPPRAAPPLPPGAIS
jgi:DNA invertase Pin-like site-specific DNA recombinase